VRRVLVFTEICVQQNGDLIIQEVLLLPAVRAPECKVPRYTHCTLLSQHSARYLLCICSSIESTSASMLYLLLYTQFCCAADMLLLLLLTVAATGCSSLCGQAALLLPAVDCLPCTAHHRGYTAVTVVTVTRRMMLLLLQQLPAQDCSVHKQHHAVLLYPDSYAGSLHLSSQDPAVAIAIAIVVQNSSSSDSKCG
jgi:hypothetical protein